MIDILNVVLAILSILVIPLIILFVSMIIKIKVLEIKVIELSNFDVKIDKKLDLILEKLIENK
jgi:hypothetical protein